MHEFVPAPRVLLIGSITEQMEKLLALLRKQTDDLHFHRQPNYAEGEIFNNLYKQAHVVLICCDLTLQDPFKDISNWKKEIKYHTTVAMPIIVLGFNSHSFGGTLDKRQFGENKLGYIEFSNDYQNEELTNIIKSIQEKLSPTSIEENSKEKKNEEPDSASRKKRCIVS